ncbi:MAG: 2OG-Fe(II) oxygenase family protein [Pseudomonadota bacterium]
MLHPDLEIDSLAAAYASDERVRITNVLADDVAERLGQILGERLPYEFAYVANGDGTSMSMENLAALTPEQRKALFGAIYSEASRGVGYLYGRFHLGAVMPYADTLVGEETQAAKDDLVFLNDFYAFLNSKELLSTIEAITSAADLTRADGQATAYRPGHFLTRHRDDPSGQERRLAYVFGFSPAWHPDWGGLLQFFEEDGTPRDAWTPEFNTLSLFDVRHIHSVTHVAPYAATPRLSITGWFRADELDA